MIKLVLLFLFLTSCSFFTKNLKERNLEEFYFPTVASSYFLEPLTKNYNFDSEANCFKNYNINFLDINLLMKSFNYNYFKAIQVQALYNQEIVKFNSDLELSVKLKENIFYNSNSKVTNGVYSFTTPDFNEINLINLDEVFEDNKVNLIKLKKLNNLLISNKMDDGVPVILSKCLMGSEIDKIFENVIYSKISSEFTSIFNEKGERIPSYQLNWIEFFKMNQKINYYTQDIKSISKNNFLIKNQKIKIKTY